jgi:hypothetical protein
VEQERVVQTKQGVAQTLNEYPDAGPNSGETSGKKKGGVAAFVDRKRRLVAEIQSLVLGSDPGISVELLVKDRAEVYRW